VSRTPGRIEFAFNINESPGAIVCQKLRRSSNFSSLLEIHTPHGSRTTRRISRGALSDSSDDISSCRRVSIPVCDGTGRQVSRGRRILAPTRSVGAASTISPSGGLRSRVLHRRSSQGIGATSTQIVCRRRPQISFSCSSTQPVGRLAVRSTSRRALASRHGRGWRGHCKRPLTAAGGD